ncbi:GNAT domain-containing protein [Echria macrotheca]|uniref:GNAT domain-containing protein n=1 Tax=Echria macrotheca TaxID=438768 RepID=A0AAJ0BGY4_9PEZI|nr:GNAT domain-containing protein [Echria macrotheca]
MANNPQGRPDRDLAETKPRLEAYLPPKDEKTFTFAICLLDTEEMIGIGGCYSLKSMFGWPVVGYMLDREYWGRGLATEFLRGWLGMWAALPRMDDQVEIEVDARTVAGGDENEGVVMEEEQVVTWTVAGENMASERVMQKSGFECFLRWREPDLRAPEVEVELVAYRYFPMRKKTTIREE